MVKLTVLVTTSPSKIPAVVLLTVAGVLGFVFFMALIVHLVRRREASEVHIR